QLCGFELKFRRKMFTHEVTYRVGEVRISPPIRWPVSVCHYTSTTDRQRASAFYPPAKRLMLARLNMQARLHRL
ncbi:MAG: hypothetical protein ACR5LH_14500, partial [Sodalis sp. (in: enterobacteria)]